MTRRLIWLAAIWLLVALCALAMWWPTRVATHGPAFATDFHKFLLSVEHFTVQGSLYAATGGETAAALLHANLNPPPFALLAWPFAQLGFVEGLAFWQWLSLAGALLAVPLLWRLAALQDRSSDRLFALAIALAATAGYPALVIYSLGQVTFLLLPVLVLALLALVGGRPMTGGLLLGALCLLKPLFGLLVLILLLRGEARAVAGAAIGGVALAAGGVLGFGPGTYLEYLTALGGVDWHDVNWNASVLGLLARLAGDGDDLPPLAYLVHMALACGLLAALLATARRAPDRTMGLRLALAGGLPLMLMLSPLGWMYYWAWCIPAAALVAPVLRAAGRGGFAWWLLLPSLGVFRVMPLAPFPQDGDLVAAIGTWSFYLLLAAASFATVLAAGRIAARCHPVTSV